MNSTANAAGPEVLLRIARFCLYATTAVPLVAIPGFFFPFVTTRAVYFRVLVEIAVAILLYLALRRETVLNVRKDFVLLALACWVGANALAAAFGLSPLRSVFGDHERMGGVWFWLHLLGFYVALRAFLHERHWRFFFRLAVCIAGLIAAYGLAQYRGRLFPRGIGGVDVGVTVGNTGLLAIYLLASVAICGLLAVRAGLLPRIGYAVLALVLILGMVFSGNRSSTLGLGFGAAVALLAFSWWSNSVKNWRMAVATLLVACVAALPFATGATWASSVTSRVPTLRRLSAGVDSSRVIQWRAAVEGIRDRPLLGVGPENYQMVWSRFYHPEMYRFTSDTRWDRAHNAYLDAFATAGLLGFLSLLAIFLALIWSSNEARKNVREAGDGAGERRRRAEAAIVAGFFAAYAFCLFFWFFDINSVTLWIVLAAFVSGRAAGSGFAIFGAPREDRWQTKVVLAAGGLVLLAVLYVHGFETLRMARALDRASERGRAPEAVLRDFQAVFRSPAPVTEHVFPMYASHLASLRPRFAEIRASPVSAALFDRAFVLAIEEFERQAARDPHNERVSVHHARVLILGAYYYDNMRLYESALRRLERAVELAPRRVPTRLSLGMAYLNVQRTREALAEFDTAYALYPPHGQTKAYIGLAYASLRENGKAVGWLKAALTAGYELDRGILLRIARAVADSGEPALGGDLLRHYLVNKYGPVALWGLSSAGNAADYGLANLAADYYQRSGESQVARSLSAAAPALCERVVPLPTLGAAVLQHGLKQPPDCREPWRTMIGY